MELSDVIRDKFEGLKTQILDYFDQRGMEASGEFRDNLVIEQEITGHRIVTRLMAAHYVEQLAFGRRPGTFPPPDRIREWIESKPSAQNAFEWATLKEYEKKGVVYIIGRKMKEEGSRYYREGGTALLESTTQDALDVLFNEIITNFTEYYVSSFVTEYRKAWSE